MKGMGQIISWSIRDESLHCEGIIKLFHTFVKERDCLTKQVKEAIIDQCQKTVRLEDAFIDLAFEMGPVNGMSPKEIKKYIRYLADWRLGQLGFAPVYMVDEHPLPWLAPMLNGVEHANFFETRATEYSKAATRGNWNEVWDNFDRRMKAKADAAANDGSDGESDPDMFTAAGVAAECRGRLVRRSFSVGGICSRRLGLLLNDGCWPAARLAERTSRLQRRPASLECPRTGDSGVTAHRRLSA
jgi:ribonucleoside-diphosphate reductase beta chain